MNSSAARNLRVGSAVLLAAALLFATLALTGPCGIASGRRVAVDFNFAGPIKTGAAVRISGVVVGSVEDVEFLAGKDAKAGEDVMVRVHARIQERAQSVVTETATFYVTTLGVLGEHYLDIAPHPGGTPLADGSKIRGTDLARADLLLPRAAGLLEISDALVSEHREELTSTLRTLSSLLVEVNRALQETDTASLADESRAALTDTRDVLAALKVALGDGRDVRAAIPSAHRLVKRADKALVRFETLPLEATLDEGRSALGEGRVALKEGRVALKEGRGTLRKVDGVLVDVADGPLVNAKRQKELARTFEKTFLALEKVADRADRLLLKIEKREGAAGEAFHDKELVNDLKAVLKSFRESPMKMFLP